MRQPTAFDRWFGDSRAVQSDGEPAVFYHGTTAGEFDAFRPHYRKGEQVGMGIHFTQDSEFAKRYAEDESTARRGKKPHVFAVYLKAERPLDLRKIVKEGSPEFALANRLQGKVAYRHRDEDGKELIYMQAAVDSTNGKRAEKLIRAAGYDSMIYNAKLMRKAYGGAYNDGEAETWVVFEPTQVKSIHNAGTFDPNDPRILS